MSMARTESEAAVASAIEDLRTANDARMMRLSKADHANVTKAAATFAVVAVNRLLREIAESDPDSAQWIARDLECIAGNYTKEET